jgi:cell division protein ZapA
MKQLEVQIMGQSYLLGCPEGGDASLLDVVNRVDLAMCKIRDTGKVKARDRIAVLAALNLVFEAQNQLQTQLDAQSQAQTQAHAAVVAQLQAQVDASTLAVVPVPPALSYDTANAMSESESAQLMTLIERMDVALSDNPQLF